MKWFGTILFSGIVALFVFANHANQKDNQPITGTKQQIAEQFATLKPESAKDPFDSMTIPYLREREYESQIGEMKLYREYPNYTSYLTNYMSDGNKINALLTIPKPEGPHPAIVFVHGYIAPSIYQTTEKYVEYVDYLARSGFVVFKIDLRGHGSSEGLPTGSYYSGDYVIDTLNAYSALQNLESVDPKQVGLWGHSMAGNITFRSMVAKQNIPAVVIWAGAGFTYDDLQAYRIMDTSYRPPSTNTEVSERRARLRELHGEFDSSDSFWQQVTPINYLEGVQGAIQLNHSVDDNVVSIVKRIFEWVGMERLSVYEVKKRLYDEGIMPRKNLRKIWSNGTIRRLLRNEAYLTGVIHYNKSEAVVTKNPTKNEKYRKVKKGSRRVRAKDEWIPHHIMPILAGNGLFEKVQSILDHYAKYQPKNKKYDYLLSGLVWCECGERRVGDGYSGNHYYRCVERIKSMPIPATCKAQGVNAVLTDGFLWVKMEKFLSDKEQMREQAKKWLMLEQIKGSSDQSERAKLTNQLESLESEKLRYTKAYGSGTIEEAQLKVLLRELDQKMTTLQKRAKSLDTTSMVSVVDDNLVAKLCDEAMVVLHSQTQSEKKRLIQDIIDKVTFYDKGVVRVEGHIPQFAQNMAYGTERRYCGIAKCREKHTL